MRRTCGPFVSVFVAALACAVRVVDSQAPPANILLVTIDTVRADHLGAYGSRIAATPAIDRLAAEGIRFADATSQAPLTGPAHAALLTGMYPARFGVRDNAAAPIPDSATTIAEIVKARGYRTGAFIGAFILDRQYGFAQGFDTFDASFQHFAAGSKLQARRPGGDVAAAAIKWLGDETDRPFFAWVHLYDAHAPYEAPPSLAARFKTSPYDAAVAYVDASIGRLVSALGSRIDRTLVSVIADHGEGLGDHGEREHGMFLYDAVLHIPWIVRLPGRQSAGVVVDSQVRGVDLVPTLLDFAGLPVPRGLDGESAAPLVRGQARRDTPPSYAETYYPKLHYGWSELKSVRVGEWKYIDAPRPELYELRQDPREQQNVADRRAALAAGLSAEIAKRDAQFGASATAPPPQPDPATLARLRSLGYVGVASAATGARGIDPKDMISKVEQLRTGISRALDALDRKQTDAAVADLKRLLAVDDRSYEVHLFLGDAYAARKEYGPALDEYAAATVLYPRSAEPLISTARVLVAQGNTHDALEKLSAAEALEPASSEIALVRGDVYAQLGKPAAAFSEYEAAVRANGSDAQARVRLAALALRAGRLDTARDQFETLLKMGYRPSRMHFGLAQVAEAEGDKKRAAAEYRRALQIEPALTEARKALDKLGS